MASSTDVVKKTTITCLYYVSISVSNSTLSSCSQELMSMFLLLLYLVYSSSIFLRVIVVLEC